MTEYIRPSRYEKLQVRECWYNARAFLKNELNIGYGCIEEVSKDDSKVVFRMKYRPEVSLTVYRKISKIKFN